MNPWLNVAFQVLASAAIVAGVLIFMWRLPGSSEPFYGIAPSLAFICPWLGVAAVVASAMLWFTATPDFWVTLVFLALDPAAIAAGVLVLWIYRGPRKSGKVGTDIQTINMQCLQARIGISLGMVAVAIGYAYVLTHKTPFTPVGM